MFEQLVVKLKNTTKKYFELTDIEPKQKIGGKSGVCWEVDAKGVLADGEFIIIECRQRKKHSSQSEIAALAYTIKDCGAKGGIFVTGHPLQRGAAKVAEYENIHNVILDLESTETAYGMECQRTDRLGKHIAVGFEEKIGVSDNFFHKTPLDASRA
ncbi:MAG: restriction endonuclease [Rhodobacteraceae bacterium]|nr:restriction endonuclease [Paracoccaceae bacterium]MCY4196355.1 restriction endonuclease [Paracoccaceae bacterium]